MSEQQTAGLTGLVTNYVSGKVHDISAHTKQAGLGLALQVVGFIPLVIAAVIGLGQMLGDRYAASSVIVSIVLISAGIVVEKTALRRLRQEDLRFARSPARQSDVPALSPAITQSAGLALMVFGRFLKSRSESVPR